MADIIIIASTLSTISFNFEIMKHIKAVNPSIKKILSASITVGIFHFIMPLFGYIISYQLNKILPINTDLILGIILILISLQMCIEYIKPSKKVV